MILSSTFQRLLHQEAERMKLKFIMMVITAPA